MTQSEVQEAGRGAAAGGRWLRIGLGVLALAALVLLGRQAAGLVQDFAAWVATLGFWGPAVFMAGYALAVIGFVPGSILTLGAGVIFGLLAGTLYVFLAASVGACAAFLIARYLARGAVEKRLEGNPRFAAIDRAVAQQGLKITFLLRLSPVFPFNLLNYALGLTRVRFADYTLACLGMIPGTLLYVYLGSLVGDLASIAAGETGASDATRRWIFLIGLAVTVLVTVVITRIARRALRDATDGLEETS
jgi:uncharacterized membrane protein YdjX (TVP38/TMEM64 family)